MDLFVKFVVSLFELMMFSVDKKIGYVDIMYFKFVSEVDENLKEYVLNIVEWFGKEGI